MQEKNITIFERLKRVWYKKFKLLNPVTENFIAYSFDNERELHVITCEFIHSHFYWEEPKIEKFNIYSSDTGEWREADGLLFVPFFKDNWATPGIIARRHMRQAKELERVKEFQEKYKLQK